MIFPIKPRIHFQAFSNKIVASLALTFMLLLLCLHLQEGNDAFQEMLPTVNTSLPPVPSAIPQYRPYKCHPDRVRLSFVSKQDILERFEGTPRKVCNCEGLERKPVLKPEYIQSMCSDEATLLGENQNAITFSLFSKSQSTWNATKARYFDGIMDNLRLMKELYPGWVMRVYTNVSFFSEVCDVVCSDNAIYFCDIRRLPQVGDVSNIHPMTWRFLAMGDPTVKEFAVRDLDSRLSQREKDCVDQWEKSEYPLHGMRDHPWHGTPIMGGMWGADNLKLCLEVAQGIQKIIMDPLWTAFHLDDQHILSGAIYSLHKKKILTHDSYLCEAYSDSVPFPTKRPNDWDHVGRVYERFNTAALTKCPLACRPTYGKTWNYC